MENHNEQHNEATWSALLDKAFPKQCLRFSDGTLHPDAINLVENALLVVPLPQAKLAGIALRGGRMAVTGAQVLAKTGQALMRSGRALEDGVQALGRAARFVWNNSGVRAGSGGNGPGGGATVLLGARADTMENSFQDTTLGECGLDTQDVKERIVAMIKNRNNPLPGNLPSNLLDIRTGNVSAKVSGYELNNTNNTTQQVPIMTSDRIRSERQTIPSIRSSEVPAGSAPRARFGAGK